VVENGPDIYGAHFRRARLDASRRLALPEYEDRATAARAIGVSDSFLKQIENGQKRPSFEVLENIARTYNVPLGDLFPTSTPKGTEADRLLGPLMMLPATPRTLLMAQFEGMARALAASIADVQLRASMTAVTRDVDASSDTPSRPVSPLGGSIAAVSRAKQTMAVQDVSKTQKEAGEER
jgi:transcriptional regulator with XRE-family HTH domain